jgi:exodeoxyribonuclease VII large subunit
LKVLGRGYSIAEKDGQVLRRVEDAAPGDKINVKLAGGSLGCVVEDINNG